MFPVPKSRSSYHSKPLLPIRHPQRAQSPRQTFRQVLLLLTLVFVGSLLLPGSDQHDKSQAAPSALEQQANAQAHANEVLAKVGSPLPSSPPPKSQQGKKDVGSRDDTLDAASRDDDASLLSSPTHGHGKGMNGDDTSPSSHAAIDHHILVEDGVALSAARVASMNAGKGSTRAEMQDSMDRPSSFTSSDDSSSSSTDSDSKLSLSETTKTTPQRPPPREGDPRWSKYAVIVKSGKDVVEDRFPPLLATSLRGVKNLILVGDAHMQNVGDTGVDMVDVVTSVVNPVHLVTEKGSDGAGEDGAEDGDKPIKNVEDGEGQQKPKEKRKPQEEGEKAKPKRIEDTRGWKLDAFKFLPSIREAYRQYPKADWFLIADDDTYFFMESIHVALSNYLPSERHYFGSGNLFVGCDGVSRFGEGPTFAHGGGGIVLSRGAVQALVPNLATCIPKYFECWAGDVQLSLCLRDSGIRHTDIGHGFRFYQDNPGSDKWTFPTSTGGACERPLSMHHLHAGDLDKLKSAEQSARFKAKYASKMEQVVSHKTHPWLYSPTEQSGKLVAATSEFYSPVNMGDIWRAFMVGDRRTRGQRRAVGTSSAADSNASGNDKQGTSALITTLEIASADKCSDKCERHHREGEKTNKSATSCLTWDYDTKSHKCRLFDSLARMEPAMGWVTGAREGAEKKLGKDGLYTCERREL